MDPTVLVSGTTRSSRTIRTSAYVLEAIQKLAPRTFVRKPDGGRHGGSLMSERDIRVRNNNNEHAGAGQTK
jgi:hypothetical protein